MNQQDKIYADYKKQVEVLVEYEVIDDPSEVNALRKGLEPFTYNTKIADNPNGTYKLADGRILETTISFGNWVRGFIFKNEKEWEIYNPAMPRCVYFEM